MKHSLLVKGTIIYGLLNSTSVIAQTSDIEEIVVRGKVLQADQINALKIPTPFLMFLSLCRSLLMKIFAVKE